MTALACALLLAMPQAKPKVIVLDDFTVTPWSWTLTGTNGKSHDWQNLDRRHCIFGERQSFTIINSNPNQTTLTFSIGAREQKLTSPLQVSWHHELQYGNDGSTDVDLSAVNKFYLDMYAVGGSYIPDAMTLSVHDAAFHSGTIGFNGRIGGVYFDKKNFPSNIDWHHITFLKLRQDFDSLPNPTTYSATRFYATVVPGLSGPGTEIPPPRD